jgi:uncharacterized protein (DUF1697 family)
VRKAVRRIVDSFGINSEVFIRTRAQLLALTKANPYPAAARDYPGRLGACFFHRARGWPEALLHPPDPVRVTALGATLVVDYGPGTANTRFSIENLAGATMTERTWNTVVGLAERLKAMR